MKTPSLEAIAIRAVLESFNINVQLHFMGKVTDFIQLFKNNNLSEIIIICCHGENGKLFLPRLAPEIEKHMPYRNFLTPRDCSEFIKLNKQLIVNTGCIGADFGKVFFCQKERKLI